MNQDPITYRHPRNLNQAFGAHTSQEVEPMQDEFDDLSDSVILYGCAFAMAWIAFVILVWG